MTVKGETRNAKRFHIWLDKEDAEWYKQMFGTEMGFSRAIRTVMKSYRKAIEAQVAHKIQGKRLTDDERDEILAGVTIASGPNGE